MDVEDDAQALAAIADRHGMDDKQMSGMAVLLSVAIHAGLDWTEALVNRVRELRT